MNRHIRHRTLAQIGPDGQRRLAAASVVVVGCGALGSVLSQVMVRAGVGLVRLVDPDRAELHNLHRQLLYDEGDVASGRAKAEIAAERLRRINSEVEVEARVVRAEPATIADLIEGADLVLDGTDNFEARVVVNEACVHSRLPWVYGGVVGTTGMVLPVVPGRGPCWRCFMPEVPEDAGAQLEASGILSTAPLLVASVQATEGLKLLVEPGAVRTDLLAVDLWSGRFDRFTVRRDPDCACCGERAASAGEAARSPGLR
jgi:adenylyltransferase/sulfurtransferase